MRSSTCNIPEKGIALNEEDKSLPSQWFRDERIYSIERRAIFSKLWILATHTSRFTKAGDYFKLEYAGYPYFVIKTKEGGFNAFHNVCRHRAFPLIHKETGSSMVLGCKYHGWSYNSSNGHLIKAPQFDKLTGSPTHQKEENGLFKIHTHVTESGFIFINFNAAPLEPSDDKTAPASTTSITENLVMAKGTANGTPHISIALELETSVNEAAAESSKTPALPECVETCEAAANAPQDPVFQSETVPLPDEGTDDVDWDSDSDAGSLVTAPESPSSEEDEEDNIKTPIDWPSSSLPDVKSRIECTVPFKEHFGSLPSEWEGFKPDEYEFAYSWTRMGPYNWKTFMDGYQECYHCLIAHPGFAKALALETYAVATKSNYARHTAENKPNAVGPIGASENDVSPTFTFVFPTNGVTVTSVMWYMMRAVPVSATETRMEYDVFKRKTVSMEYLRKYMEFYEQVEEEDFLLCCACQRNLNSGIYSRGFLHPEKEVGVLFYQSRARAFVEEHVELEKEAGVEINPAQPVSQTTSCSSGNGNQDTICSSLGPEMTW